MNKIVALFGIVFLVFAIIVFFQINAKTIDNLLHRSPTSNVTINSATFKVEIAKTQTELMNGLSGRNSLAQDQGMLFVFEKPSNYSFWMRGMKIPLDFVFIKDNKVVRVFENVPAAAAGDANPPQFGSDVVSDKILEINAGLVKKYKIKAGDTVTFQLK
jgi:uncharacterized membrane protein (UPF0127 family)